MEEHLGNCLVVLVFVEFEDSDGIEAAMELGGIQGVVHLEQVDFAGNNYLVSNLVYY